MTDAWEQAPWLATLARTFHGRGQTLYLVGGAVRNPLMGLPLSDVDVCGVPRPEEVVDLCRHTAVRADIRAAHFGTVELHLTGPDGKRYMAEYTTFREDSYRCGHKPENVRFATDISVDALRRDFSVNALYRELLPEGLGPVIDPTGGLASLGAGTLHTVTPEPDQVLKDDGLRILRAVRFQAELDLRPTAELLASLERHAALLRDIAPERLREELVKTLLADLRYPSLARRAPAAQTGMDTLRTIGAWPYVLGDLAWDDAGVAALKNIKQPTSDALVSAPADPLCLRMALLARRADPALLESVMDRLRFSGREIKESAALVRMIQALENGPLDPAYGVRAGLAMLAGAEALLLALGHEGAARRAGDLRRDVARRRIPLQLRDLALGGNDMLALCADTGAKPALIGGALNRLWDQVCRGALENTKEALLPAARQLLDGGANAKRL